MSVMERHDNDFQMFVQKTRDADHAHLQFFRWLSEQGRLEHPVSGPPCGAFASPASRAYASRACVPRWFGR
jgi:hypothetical protein